MAGEGVSSDRARLYLVVPVLNEAANLGRFAESVRGLRDQLSSEIDLRWVLVDDGSTDGTGALALDLARGLDLRVLTHPTNLGPGHAFGTAFESLAGTLRPQDWVVTLEGDNTSRVELLRQMLTRTAEGYDVVLASPYMYGGGLLQTTPWRVFMSHVANLIVKELLGIHGILTMSSFYRLYRGSLVLRLQEVWGPRVIERRGFESMVELLMKTILVEARISEVAMVLDSSRRAGKSRMPVWRTVRGYLTLWRDARRWRRTSEAWRGRRATASAEGA